MGNLPANIETLTAEILIYKDNAGRCVIEIGKRLKQVKESLPHGEWLPYLEKRVEFAERTAQQFIRCAEEFGNAQLTADLPTGHMFELLALPSEQREGFMQEHDVTAMTQKQLREAVRAQKAAEQRAEEAESKVQAMAQRTAQAEAQQNAAEQKAAQTDKLKTQVKILEDKLRSAGDPVIVEQPVQVFPPDYERVKRENAELKARQQGLTLQQLTEVNENCRQYAKTEAEEEKLAKVVLRVLAALNELPIQQEMSELARCYLKQSSADSADEIIVTCSEINNGIRKLEQLKAALQETTKLRVVK